MRLAIGRPGLVGQLLIGVGLIWLLLWWQRGWDSPGEQATLRRSAGPLTETIDPQLVISNNDGVITTDLFEGLVTATASGEIVPGAAQRWEISADGLRYRFYLRESGRWSNGEPLTAADFVFAWRRLVDPRTAAPYASFLDPIRNAPEIIAGRLPPDQLGVRALGPQVLEVELSRPTPFFLQQLRHYATFPVPADALRRFGTRWTRPGTLVSNGAYRLDKWLPGGELTLRRNPQFHDAAAVRYARVIYLPLEDPATELSMWKSGALDITWELQPSMLAQLRADYPQALHVEPLLGTFFLALNLARPGLSDVRVRQALAMAIDRDSLVRDITRSGEQPATRWIPPSTPGVLPFEPEWAAWPLEKRRQRAIALLRESGLDAAHPLSFDLVYDIGSVHREVAVACADMWKAIGVTTHLVNVERRVLSSLRTDRRFDLLRAGWTGDYADAHTFLEIWLSGAGGLNQSRYHSDRYDWLVERSRAEVDASRRASLVRDAESQLIADMPMIPLYFLARRTLVRGTVCGWGHDPVLDPATRWLYPRPGRSTLPAC